MAKEVRAFRIGEVLVEENISGSEEEIVYRANGKVYKTKEEAERVDAEWDLKHLLERLGLQGVTSQRMIEDMKSHKREFLDILYRL